MPRILLVDADEDLVLLLACVLRLNGYEAEVAHTARAGLERFRQARPDLVVLDHFLPDSSGEEVCGRLRQVSNVPIVMLTAHAQESAVVRLLESGADDYILKPFRPREFLARIGALLRRAGHAQERGAERVEVGPLVLNLRTRELHLGEWPLVLTPIEFRLLHALAADAGRVVSFEELVARVWGHAGAGSEQLVRVHVSRLRKKLEAAGGPGLIASHPRVGYYLRLD